MGDVIPPVKRSRVGLPIAVGFLGVLAAAAALFAIILIGSDEIPPPWLYAVLFGGVLVAVAGFAWALGSVLGRLWPRD